MQIIALEDKRQTEQRTCHKLCRTVDDTPHGSIFDPNGMHAGDQRSQPMSEIDNICARDAREEILGAPRETGYLVRKDRPADDQLVVFKDHTVERHEHLIHQQPIGQLVCFLARYGANSLERMRVRPVVVEDLYIGIAFRSLTCRYPHQLVNRFFRHGWVSSQGNEIIQLRHAPPKLFIEQAKDQWYRCCAGSIWNDDQDAPTIDRQRITGPCE